MLVSELLMRQQPLSGLNKQVFNELLPHFHLREDGGGDAGGDAGGDVGADDGEAEPENYPGRPFLYAGPNRWFNQLYASIKHLIVANNILKRMNELGLSKEAQNRVKLAAKTAAKHVTLLLSNPGSVAYRIPVWTTQAPPKPVIKMWNESFAKEFAKELNKVNLEEK